METQTQNINNESVKTSIKMLEYFLDDHPENREVAEAHLCVNDVRSFCGRFPQKARYDFTRLAGSFCGIDVLQDRMTPPGRARLISREGKVLKEFFV